MNYRSYSMLQFECIEDGCETIICMNSRNRVIRCGKHARLKRDSINAMLLRETNE